MKTQTVYKLDSKGKQRSWSIRVDDLGDSSNIVIISGLLDGKKVEEIINIKEGKNKNKKNATTPYTQAVSEAKAKLELKERGEYVRNLSEVSQGVLRSGISKPMKAHKHDPEGKQSNSKTLSKMGIEGDNIHAQPKYDGNRCLTKVDADSVELYTAEGDKMLPIPHIEQELRESYDKVYKNQDDRELVLDGELHSTDMSFNTLNGLLRKENKTEEQKELLKKVQYKLYDVMTGDGYARRYELIKPFASENVLITPSYEIKATNENIKKKLEEFLEEGHEGLMIRTLNKGYENKRTWQLVKVKLFEDAEFKIIDLEPSSMGRLGKVVLELTKPTVDRDGKVVTTFKAGLGKGINHKEGLKMLNNKQNYIGKMGTVEFFGLSEYGIPRFPKFKSIREKI